MDRRVARVLVVGGAFGAAVVATVLWSSVVAGVSVVALVVWQLAKCRHTQPLGLLPPVVNERGEQVPARWYCDECGKSWPAMFDRGRRPVPRFTGYDQSKAAEAAKRADELEERTRALALRRSGINHPAPVAKARVRPAPPLKPLSIHNRRIAG
jgi:hypothetical protein